MTSFFYQIKARLTEPEVGLYSGTSNWEWPPIFCGKVEAENKKEAKKIIDDEYGRVFPLRVLQTDLKQYPFLLNVEKIKIGSRQEDLFKPQTCIHCKSIFYVIDKYNDSRVYNKGFDYCSDKCKQDSDGIRESLRLQGLALSGNSEPVIYKITNKVTGKCYIGKTTQVFTLRWYQHFFQNGNCKFHEEIKKSKVSDWIFQVQEIIVIPEGVKDILEIEKLIIERERHYILQFDSIENGYNSKK